MCVCNGWIFLFVLRFDLLSLFLQMMDHLVSELLTFTLRQEQEVCVTTGRRNVQEI